MRKRLKAREIGLPTTSQLEKELFRVKYKARYKSLFKSTIYTLLVVVALSVLVAIFLFPVLQITGKSMRPTIIEGDIVVAVKGIEFERGDVIAFYYNNRILVKRVIATSSEWVNIDSEGNVFINGKLLDEKYITNKSLGKVDIKFPYQVPEGTYFVLGDERESSIDSRNSLIGTVPEEDIIGKIIFRVWPFKRVRIIN